MTGVPKSVREAMIEAAWLLIAERGLEGMSTREVLARTGAPRGSVYHHFPRGRTELIELAIDHSRQWMQEQIGAIDAKDPDDVVARLPRHLATCGRRHWFPRRLSRDRGRDRGTRAQHPRTGEGGVRRHERCAGSPFQEGRAGT